MSGWIEIRATLPETLEDVSVFVDAFTEHGCPSVLEEENPKALVGYLTQVEAAAMQSKALVASLMELGALNVSLGEIPDQDWSELWKTHFKPRRVGNRFVIRPTWEEYASGPEDLELVLDPGQAFGTGDHPTTRLCLELMESLPISGVRVADVGCGSGVLAIGAMRLGAASVLATDIDPVAVEVTQENAARNGVALDARTVDGMETLLAEGPFPVVISNIISATLIRIAPDAARLVAPGGVWVVSGIMVFNSPDVIEAAERVGFKLEIQREEDEWVGLVLRRFGP